MTLRTSSLKKEKKNIAKCFNARKKSTSKDNNEHEDDEKKDKKQKKGSDQYGNLTNEITNVVSR